MKSLTLKLIAITLIAICWSCGSDGDNRLDIGTIYELDEAIPGDWTLGGSSAVMRLNTNGTGQLYSSLGDFNAHSGAQALRWRIAADKSVYIYVGQELKWHLRLDNPVITTLSTLQWRNYTLGTSTGEPSPTDPDAPLGTDPTPTHTDAYGAYSLWQWTRIVP